MFECLIYLLSFVFELWFRQWSCTRSKGYCNALSLHWSLSHLTKCFGAFFHRFGIDDCIRKNVVSTYQSNFWGPWWTYRMVPDEKKVASWTSFLVASLDLLCLLVDIVV